MNPFDIIVPAFIIRTLRNGLYLIFLWQLKEYRLDRVVAHLRTSQGRKLLLGVLPITKWILLPFILADIFLEKYLPFKESFLWHDPFLIFWLIWLVESIFNTRELFTRGWRLPKFTPKAITILILSLIISLIVTLYPYQSDATILLTRVLIGGILVDKLLAPLIAILVLLSNIPASLYKKWITLQAKNKILSFPNLMVVGITGSYGKTSTKEFLATILSEKFNVAKTPEFTNTDIGIANYILKDLKPEHEVLVVEMGAYKKGEIKTICDMVQPKMGIITGINEQHLELFGSIENTMKTKFELIESLPKGGVAIFNGNNDYCRKIAKWVKDLKLKAFTVDLNKDVKNIKTFTDHLEFTLTENNYLIKVNLLGKQAIENLLAAIYAARNLGLTLEEIKKGIAKIIPAAKTMQSVGKVGGMMLVDDTFNANPDGIMAALDYMKIFKGKKILVLTPLIELGQEADKIHTDIGEKASKICDLILLTNINYHRSFIEGARKVGGEAKIQIVNATVGLKLIKENLDKEGVAVFEGKEAGRILEKLV